MHSQTLSIPNWRHPPSGGGGGGGGHMVSHRKTMVVTLNCHSGLHHSTGCDTWYPYGASISSTHRGGGGGAKRCSAFTVTEYKAEHSGRHTNEPVKARKEKCKEKCKTWSCRKNGSSPVPEVWRCEQFSFVVEQRWFRLSTATLFHRRRCLCKSEATRRDNSCMAPDNTMDTDSPAKQGTVASRAGCWQWGGGFRSVTMRRQAQR